MNRQTARLYVVTGAVWLIGFLGVGGSFVG